MNLWETVGAYSLLCTGLKQASNRIKLGYMIGFCFDFCQHKRWLGANSDIEIGIYWKTCLLLTSTERTPTWSKELFVYSLFFYKICLLPFKKWNFCIINKILWKRLLKCFFIRTQRHYNTIISLYIMRRVSRVFRY